MGSYDSNNTNSGKSRPPQRAPQKPYEPLTEEGYVKRAEQVIDRLKDPSGKIRLTTTALRNVLAMVNQIYNDVIMTTEDKLSEDTQAQLRYLKVKIIYAAGRNPEVGKLVQESQIADHVDHIGSSRKNFILFSHYMEALVAYHRFSGGRDA